MRPGELKILQTLAAAPEGLTFSQIKSQTKLSHTAIADYLNTLQTLGIVRKNFETRRYLLAAIYLPPDNLNDWQLTLKAGTLIILRLGAKIRQIKPLEKRRETLKALMEFTFHYLTVVLWKIVGESLADYTKNNITDPSLADKRTSTVKQGIEDWVVGIADAAAIAMAFNTDLLDEVGDEIWKQKLEQLRQLLETLYKCTGLKF